MPFAPAPQFLPLDSLTPPATEPPLHRSGNWLGIIGIICFVLAAASLVHLSIESGWLNPARQVILATLLASP